MIIANIQMLMGIVAYLMITIMVGLWYAGRSNTGIEEYFIGKRGLGPWVAAMSAEASDMSGWLLMGLPGVAYFTGCGEAFWTAAGLFVGTWLNWQLVAKRLRNYSQTTDNAITLPEFFSKRFHDKKSVLKIIAAIIILVFFSIYTASQFVAFGKLFTYVFKTENYYSMIVVLGAVILLIYTLLGGFLAVCMTDLIQGILMSFSLLVVLAFGLAFSGGFSGVGERLGDIPRFLDVFGIATPAMQNGVQAVTAGAPQFGSGADYPLLSIFSCLAWGLGYFGMPHVLIRFMAIENVSKIRKSKLIAITWCFISLTAAVAIGLVGRAYFPSLLGTASDAENIFLYLTSDFFPPLLAGVVISGILAASMSSSDSYMIAVSSSLANDLFKTFFKEARESAVMWVARLAIVLVMIFATIIALSGNQSVFRIVSYAWAGFGAAFGPLVLFALFWKRVTLQGAAAGMLSGGVMVVLWKNVISKLGGVFGIYELLPSFILSCAVIFVVSLLTKAPSAEIQREFDSVKAAERG
ncbi:MAG: sodium/proline symporter PutP [Treponema sp.]|jgi:sodium/proline symporter|nr:sodium/proline symporter PutP [Treponema sp.]